VSVIYVGSRGHWVVRYGGAGDYLIPWLDGWRRGKARSGSIMRSKAPGQCGIFRDCSGGIPSDLLISGAVS
jgi:hypothetical protein